MPSRIKTTVVGSYPVPSWLVGIPRASFCVMPSVQY